MGDTRWVEEIKILFRERFKIEPKRDDIEPLSFLNDVIFYKAIQFLPVRYFHHKRISFFHNILLKDDSILGDIIDYFGVIEFQHRGSPHCHMILWIKNAPTLSSTNVDQIKELSNKYITMDTSQVPQRLRCLQTRHAFRCNPKKEKGKCSFGFPATIN